MKNSFKMLKVSLFTLIFLIILLFISGIIHEAGHIVIFLIGKVPCCKLYTDITHGALFKVGFQDTQSTAIKVSKYFGGLFSGSVLIILYLTFRKWFHSGRPEYIIVKVGVIFMLIGMQITQGISEGYLSEKYYSINSPFDIGPVSILTTFVMVSSVFFSLMINRNLLTKSKTLKR